ncbi:YGGT family protein [Bombilactobacillus mellifer]|uniref:YGGT family protein n=1 Tax=Bombilactobacillus mellifer TaxID=1218492 RepID=A0A0F4LSW1_9LACO|nr:YggT family protein [Bombilactobacillus mellifer]KJY61907.1 YGGT family protein [Bombilactobacillus mellifer]MCT6825599.1 YggT family protein [Bombilactobacillus mellifer]MCT6843354.1 YggT family protein [Bombilactobacillus mellifer]MCT6893842.1 YggT family protein [Bombilactobacillus mellifer]
MTNLVTGLPIVLIDIMEIYKWVIIIAALLTWLPGAYQSKIGQFFARLTEPVLGFFDRIIPPIFGISLSPIWAFLVIDIIEHLITKLI